MITENEQKRNMNYAVKRQAKIESEKKYKHVLKKRKKAHKKFLIADKKFMKGQATLNELQLKHDKAYKAYSKYKKICLELENIINPQI